VEDSAQGSVRVCGTTDRAPALPPTQCLRSLIFNAGLMLPTPVVVCGESKM
jgi:hypothetical protein